MKRGELIDKLKTVVSYEEANILACMLVSRTGKLKVKKLIRVYDERIIITFSSDGEKVWIEDNPLQAQAMKEYYAQGRHLTSRLDRDINKYSEAIEMMREERRKSSQEYDYGIQAYEKEIARLKAQKERQTEHVLNSVPRESAQSILSDWRVQTPSMTSLSPQLSLAV